MATWTTDSAVAQTVACLAAGATAITFFFTWAQYRRAEKQAKNAQADAERARESAATAREQAGQVAALANAARQREERELFDRRWAIFVATKRLIVASHAHEPMHGKKAEWWSEAQKIEFLFPEGSPVHAFRDELEAAVDAVNASHGDYAAAEAQFSHGSEVEQLAARREVLDPFIEARFKAHQQLENLGRKVNEVFESSLRIA